MKKSTRYIGGAVIILLGVLSLSACSVTGNRAVQSDQKVSATILGKYEQSQPAPIFDWSQIRQTLIDIETAQASLSKRLVSSSIKAFKILTTSALRLGSQLPQQLN